MRRIYSTLANALSTRDAMDLCRKRKDRHQDKKWCRDRPTMPAMLSPPDVLISEVGPRNGLQSVKVTMPTAAKPAQVGRLFTRLRSASGDRSGAVSTGIDVDALIAAREPLKAGLPGEPLYGLMPDAGLPKGWRRQARHG
jgi:hypothetical protein